MYMDKLWVQISVIGSFVILGLLVGEVLRIFFCNYYIIYVRFEGVVYVKYDLIKFQQQRYILVNVYIGFELFVLNMY